MTAIREAWGEARPSIGRWQGAVTTLEAERIGALGYDWVLYDLESSGLDWDALIPLFQATELGGTRTMVRVPWNDPAAIMRALDYGAIGVVVPMVSTAEEAERAAGATRYPPDGYRSNAPLRRRFSSRAVANDEIVCVAMIETAEAWANLEAIAATPGIDVLMLGQVDLAIALGWIGPDEPGINIATDPRCVEALERVSDVASRYGKKAGAGTVGASEAEVETLLSLGVRWLGYRPFDRTQEERERANLGNWKKARE